MSMEQHLWAARPYCYYYCCPPPSGFTVVKVYVSANPKSLVSDHARNYTNTPAFQFFEECIVKSGVGVQHSAVTPAALTSCAKLNNAG